MLEQRIQQQFIDSADLLYQWAQASARPIAEGVQALLASVTGGGKVLICGNGASSALAQYLAALLVGGLERQRPELPALALGADADKARTLWVHPEDAALLIDCALPLAIASDAAMMRGTVRIETSTGWIEHGRAVYLDELRVALGEGAAA